VARLFRLYDKETEIFNNKDKKFWSYETTTGRFVMPLQLQVPNLKRCYLVSVGGTLFIQSPRRRDRLRGLKYWFGSGRVDWETGEVLEIGGPLWDHFGLSDTYFDSTGQVERPRMRVLDGSGAILPEFAALSEQILLRLSYK
jgi:hypothetical protein